MRTGAGFDSALAWAQRRAVKSPASDMKANTLFISIPRVDVRHIEYSGVDTRPRLNEVLGSIDHERHPLCWLGKLEVCAAIRGSEGSSLNKPLLVFLGTCAYC